MTSQVNNKSNNNFDLLRLLAAIGVIYTHTITLFNIQPHDFMWWLTNKDMELSTLSVRVFFIISGYLIFQSAIRTNNIRDFFLKRFLRLFPGLFISIIITLSVIGPLCTELTLREYFSSSETYSYLTNIFLFSFLKTPDKLPLVFEHNYFPTTVNGALWTLQFEVLFYFFTGGLLFIKRKNIISFIIVISLLFLLCNAIVSHIFQFQIYRSFYIMNIIDFGLYFFLGAAVNIYKDKIVWNKVYFILSVIGLFLFWNIGGIFTIAKYFLLPYVVLYICFIPSRFFNFSEKYGDYSYGLYIYAFPIQQMLVVKLQGVFSYTQQNLIILWLVSMICVLPFALLSWHLVESKALMLKKQLYIK